MPQVKIKANSQSQITTSARHLNIISADGIFDIRAPEIGVLVGVTGRAFDFESVREVEFVNETNADINVIYESTEVKTSGSSGGNVTITNDVVVSEIKTPIAVVASATVDGGTVGTLSGQILNTLPILLIPAGQARQVVSARLAVSRKVTIQNISDEVTRLHVGSNGSLNASSGLILQGSINEMSSYEMNNESELWVFNASSTVALLAAQEEYINSSSEQLAVPTEMAQSGVMDNENFENDTDSDGIPDGWNQEGVGVVSLSSTSLSVGQTMILDVNN